MMNAAEKVLDRNTLKEKVNSLRKTGGRVVFTNGCFDLLHIGHVRYLQEARKLGDCLVVAVNSDSSVHQIKEPETISKTGFWFILTRRTLNEHPASFCMAVRERAETGISGRFRFYPGGHDEHEYLSCKEV